MRMLKPIRSEEDYDAALSRSWELLQKEPDPDSRQGHELEVLITLIEKYEEQHHSIPDPDPINYIRYVMEQKGMRQSDLTAILGHKSRVSEVLNRNRKLTLEMIRVLNRELDISLDILVQDYPLKQLARRTKTSTRMTGKKSDRRTRSKKTT